MMFGWLRRGPARSTEQLRVAEALVGYPPYTPPEWKLDPNPEAMGAASFRYRDYFLASRRARLEALGTFLANFDVSLNTDDSGLMAISTWLPHWGDLLINDLDDQAGRAARSQEPQE
jgi:hypothetical protein